jgi:DNA-directed RNA polymerase specialized sigma24 family protein
MNSDTDDFRTLMRGVLDGNPEAAERLCRDYQKSILRMVRHRLPDRLRTRFDSLDFVNDVWASFFADLPRHTRLDDPDSFAAYLIAMARN